MAKIRSIINAAETKNNSAGGSTKVSTSSNKPNQPVNDPITPESYRLIIETLDKFWKDYSKQSEDIQKLSTRIDQAEQRYQKFEDKLNVNDNRFQNEEKKLIEIETRFEDSKIKVIETLGLFVAVFSFVSIEFSLLKETTLIGAISFSFILAGLLILFILCLDYVIRYWRYDWEENDRNPTIIHLWKKHFWGLVILAIIIVLLGLAIPWIWQWNGDSSKKIKDINSPVLTIPSPTPLPINVSSASASMN